MTNRYIENIKKNGKIPTDELDEFWRNFTAFFLIITYFGVSTYAFYKGITSNNILPIQYVLICSSFMLLTFAIWAKKVEKNLKVINTNLTLNENKKLIEKLCLDKSWELTENNKTYYQINLHTIFSFHTHKLIFICSEKKIFYNLRTTGTWKGRIPMNYGIDFIKEFKIKKKIKNYAQQWL